jgi:hypothetical protein
MQEVTPAHRNLARSLLVLERGDSPECTTLQRAAEHVFGKLSRHLARLVGVAGCTALFRRALHLAAVEFPFLDSVQVGTSAEVSLEGLGESLMGMPTGQAYDGLVALITRVIGLLATFIGDDLVLHLVRQIWPDLPPTDAPIG